MQVPEHIILLYVATCGQSGPALGSDEKEIILLVYAVIDVASAEIIGTKQFLVQPDGNLVKVGNSTTTTNDASLIANSNQQSIKYGITCNNLNNNNNNNNNLNNNNNNNINSNNNKSNCIVNTTGITTIQGNCLNTGNVYKEKNNNLIENGIALLAEEGIDLPPIAVAQATGKPLKESIREFDDYMRSLSLSESDVILITDGQLPLRQCLHREACVKDIDLPIYYNKFCDLRKEFVKYKNGDLSCALVPVKDIKKMLQMPTIPQPQSIAEMMKDLGLTSTQDNTFYMRESRDMITVVQTMLKNGHKFIANEVVNLVLEPGICSIDDEIDGDCVVRARGLPWQSSDQDIAKFFRGLNVANGGVALCLSPLGRRNGEALVRFISQEHRDMALKRHKHHIGNRYIEVYRATGEDFLAVAGGASNEAQSFLSKGAQVIIRMRGLPYDCTAKQVMDFFTTGENPCDVHDGAEGVLFVKKPDGRATGDAFVLFAKEADAPKALSRHRECIGQRYIELFRSTTAEVQQVLNRSMDSKTFENNQQPSSLIAQLPTVQLSLLPQHLITSGTTKNCIRLRGLPYEAQVEHILHFLDEFAKHIIYQGVHMVINAQGQPSGEAFIQMESEDSARLCAQRKHNQFMVFGKKYRYIEVFQCSGDDMNMVLNGGLQSPIAAPQTPHAALAQQQKVAAAAAAAAATATLVSPAGAAAAYMGATFPAPFTHYDPGGTTLLQAAYAAPHGAHNGATFYAAPPFYYWPYSSPPVSPNTCYNQPAAAAAAAAATAYHQTMYSLDLISAQIKFATPTAPALSPASVATQAVPAAPNTVKPHTIAACGEAYVAPSTTASTTVAAAAAMAPKAQIMTLLQFKQYSTPTITPSVPVIPLGNGKSSITTETTAVVQPQKQQKQIKQQQQQQSQQQQKQKQEETKQSQCNTTNGSSSTYNCAAAKTDAEEHCTELSVIPTSEILSINTAQAQTTFSMVARPHIAPISGRTKQSVHKVC